MTEMQRRVVAPGFVREALTSVRRMGHDPDRMLAESGIELKLDEAVSHEDFGRLWLTIARTLDDEFFGMAERPMRMGGFSLLCYCMISTSTLEHALRRGIRFLRVSLDNPRGVLTVKDGTALLALDDTEKRPAFAYRAYYVMLLGVVCWLVGRRISIRRLDFACDAPRDQPDYGRFFGAAVRFGQEDTVLAFDASYLGLPIIRSNQSLKRFLKNAPANILVRYREDFGAAALVKRHLSDAPLADWPTFEELCSRLKLRPATLRRRLKGDGQSYQTIKDELRLARAQKLLVETDKTLAAIAADLGYSEASAFYRAFGKYTGQTPGAFRQSNR